MAKLVSAVLSSLDGYFEDEQGRFDWAAPDEEVHAFVNELELLDERRFDNDVVHLHYRVGDAS